MLNDIADLTARLIEMGSSTNLLDNDSRTPQMLVNVAQLHKACESDVEGENLDTILQLLDTGVDVNAPFENNTPLHVASSRQVVQLLVSRGGNLEARNRIGKRPCHVPPTRMVSGKLCWT